MASYKKFRTFLVGKPQNQQKFYDYVFLDLCEPNDFEFWQTVENYKKIGDVQLRKRKAHDIYIKYLIPTGESPIKQVKSKAIAYEQLDGSIEEARSSLFDGIQEKVFALMAEHYWLGFLSKHPNIVLE